MITETLLIGIEGIANLYGYKMELINGDRNIKNYIFFDTNFDKDEIWLTVHPTYVKLDEHDSREIGFEALMEKVMETFQD